MEEEDEGINLEILYVFVGGLAVVGPALLALKPKERTPAKAEASGWKHGTGNGQTRTQELQRDWGRMRPEATHEEQRSYSKARARTNDMARGPQRSGATSILHVEKR
ncbi:hypothetical protein C8R45DRAFT_942552 [Mycena sanguinolenta]|nr:hypothetical protein C8R45DRAFT_942552 [Mycena sanguinolenta]